MSKKKATVVEVLTCARELIADPKHWTKDTLARNSAGLVVDVNSPDACQYCSMGAIIKCAPSTDMRGVDYTAMDALSRVVVVPVPAFNDRDATTHDDVLAAFDKAIAAEKKKDHE